MFRRFGLQPLLGALLAFAVIAGPARSGDAPEARIHGLWQVDDQGSVIELHACGSATCGRIYWSRDLAENPSADFRDSQNPDAALRNRRICGLELVGGLRPAGPGHWAGGTVYNPEDGMTYNAEARLLDNGALSFRGYVMVPLFGGTRIWTRPANTPDRCQSPADDRMASTAG